MYILIENKVGRRLSETIDAADLSRRPTHLQVNCEGRQTDKQTNTTTGTLYTEIQKGDQPRLIRNKVEM